jgi:hypothetical protein
MKQLRPYLVGLLFGYFIIGCKKDSKEQLGELIGIRNNYESLINKLNSSKDSLTEIYGYGFGDDNFIPMDTAACDCTEEQEEEFAKEKQLNYLKYLSSIKTFQQLNFKIDSLNNLQKNIKIKIDSVKEVNSIK